MSIQDQLGDLLDMIHVGRLAHVDYLTYPEPTKHFLAMVEFIEDERKTMDMSISWLGLTNILSHSMSFVTCLPILNLWSYPGVLGSIHRLEEHCNRWCILYHHRSHVKGEEPNNPLWSTPVANTIFAHHHPETSKTYELMVLYNSMQYWLHNIHGRPTEYDPIFFLDPASMFLSNL